MKRSTGYWTLERCKKEASKYKSRGDFSINSGGAYAKAYKKGWLDEICAHMSYVGTQKGFWTKERCKIEARKYNRRFDFQKESGGAYGAAKKKKWLNEICSHMEVLKKPMSKWTKHDCHEEALKFNHTTPFQIESSGAYRAAKSNGWLDEICSHMSDGKVKWTKGRCMEEALKYDLLFDFRTSSLSAYNAAYKNGWLVEISSHMIRGNPKWTEESCKKEALKYNTKKDFRTQSNKAYGTAARKGWLKSVCSHMEPKTKPNPKINKNEIPNYKYSPLLTSKQAEGLIIGSEWIEPRDIMMEESVFTQKHIYSYLLSGDSFLFSLSKPKQDNLKLAIKRVIKHAYERENKTIINPELIGKLIEGSEIIRIRHLKNEPTKVKGYVSAYLQYGNSYLNELNSNKKVKIEQHLLRIIQKARNEPKQSIEYVAQIVTCTDFKEVKELK